MKLYDYEEWAKKNNSQKFSLYDYIFGNLHAKDISDDIYIAFLKFFWPNFYCIDDYVFLKEQFEQSYYDKLVREGKGKKEIESWVNLLYLDGMMDENTSDENIKFLAEHLVEIWEIKLKKDFPQKKFKVKYFFDEDDGYFVVFYQI